MFRNFILSCVRVSTYSEVEYDLASILWNQKEVRTMKKVPIEQAVGLILAHDMTKIIPNEFKGVAYKKGHIIRDEDIEPLRNMGKNHIYIFEKNHGDYHENEGALKVAQYVAGENIDLTKPKEGKVNLLANKTGLLKIDLSGLEEINEVEGIILATKYQGAVVKQGEMIAGGKVIPLVIKGKIIEQVENITEKYGKIIQVLPFVPLRVGILVTGSEVYYGRIKDAFAPVLQRKIEDFGGTVIKVSFVPDDLDRIKNAIQRLIDIGSDVIMVTGGMSVDPDDLTPTALSSMATEVITYGSPVLPGAMFMMAYHNKIPLIGIPACGMFSKITVLDLVMPYIFSEEKVTKRMINRKAHGGLCSQCEVCQYPHCEFGKG